MWDSIALALTKLAASSPQGGYWAQVDYITLDGLREDLSVIVEDLYTHMLEEYTGGNKTGDLAALLEGGLEIDWFLDVDKGDGLGPRDVYVGPKLQDGLLRLSGLLATSANRVADLSDVELANAARDSRHWRWVVEGVEDPFLPTQSTLLADAYDRGRAVLESLVKDILVLGMIQAAVLMPICAIVSLMRMRTLLSEKGQLFAVFLTVPRPVLYHMAAGTGQLVTGREGEDAAMLDFGSELSEEEKRLVRKLERSTGKGLDKVLRFVRGDKELKDDTWRLQAVVAVPLVLMTAICLATHITANQFLQAVRDPVAAYEDTFRVEANIVQVRGREGERAE